MTLPLSSPFTSLTKVTKAQLDQVVAGVNACTFPYYGENISGSTVPLTTAATNVAGAASVTFTLTQQRRVKITVEASYRLGTTTGGQMRMLPGYNSGSSVVIGSATTIGVTGYCRNDSATTGINGANGSTTFGTVLLPAGTYTAYAVVQRAVGGSASDVAASFYTLVEDVGAV